MTPDVLTTPRLRLEPVTAATAEAVRARHRDPCWHPDFPSEDDVAAVGLGQPGDPWGPRLVVRAVDGLVVGTIGFLGPPAPGADGGPEVEVGFGVVVDARGRGVVTEALTALLAEADRAGVRVRAHVAPDNPASLRVLAKTGFTELRGASADGELELARPARAARP
ncbi:MAG: GNAT family N-acetyltransferase [Nocardioides sp.]